MTWFTLTAAATSMTTPTSTTPIQVWTLAVAILAVVATFFGAFLLRRTGKGSVAAAKQAADASHISAEAASRSAQAAQDAVGVNADSAAGIARRAEADALAKRYQDAAEQIGHDKAPVRLAGVYAMARLADDWEDQRQTCVDVLCAYLRMPWPSTTQPGGESVVRSTIVGLINEHLGGGSDDKVGLWSDIRFNFDGAELRDFYLVTPVFRTTVSFTGTTFSGGCGMFAPEFRSGVRMARATVSGRLELHRVTLGAEFYAPEVSVPEDGVFYLEQSWTVNSASITLDDARVTDGRLQLLVNPDDRKVLVVAKNVRVLGTGFAAIDFTGPDVDPAVSQWLAVPG